MGETPGVGGVTGVVGSVTKVVALPQLVAGRQALPGVGGAAPPAGSLDA